MKMNIQKKKTFYLLFIIINHILKYWKFMLHISVKLMQA